MAMVVNNSNKLPVNESKSLNGYLRVKNNRISSEVVQANTPIATAMMRLNKEGKISIDQSR